MVRRASRPRASGTRGFTLLEVLIAVLVGALGLVAAASVARWATRQSGQGRQANALLGRLQLVSRQMRTDVQVAGMGSTGAIAADCGTNPLLGQLCVTSASGQNAIPVVRGVDNLAGVRVGAFDVLAGSDAIQVVVPDHSTVQKVTVLSRGQQLFVNGVDCPQPWLFVSDHSAPNGAGRTQLVMMPAPTAAASPVALQDNLQFTVSVDSDVMCARVSTYWIDTDGVLHRSDLLPGNATVLAGAGASQISIPVLPGGEDIVTPGVADMQIAYSFSSEFAGRATPPAGRWAFSAPGTVPTLTPTNPRHWFEVRQVRFSYLMRSVRPVADVTAGSANPEEPALENRATPIRIPIQFSRHASSTTAVLTNLRYFDLNAPSGLAAEPY